MSSIFKEMFNYQGSPEEPLISKAAVTITCSYFATIYGFSYYLNKCFCRLDGLPEWLQSMLNYLFTLFLTDLKNVPVRNINCFKTVLIFTALLTVFYMIVYWNFEKTRLIRAAEKGILNNDVTHGLSYVAVLGFAGLVLVPYAFIFNVAPNSGSYRPWHYLYNDINHWVSQATRSLGPFLITSIAFLELWAQIIARKNIRRREG